MCYIFYQACGHYIHGDDAGQSATVTLIVRPRPSLENDSVPNFNLGMTFIEVNGRPYVSYVDPDCEAARSGIKPRDCVQLAVVLAGKGLEEYQDDEPKAFAYAMSCELRGVRISYNEFRKLFENCTSAPTVNYENFNHIEAQHYSTLSNKKLDSLNVNNNQQQTQHEGETITKGKKGRVSLRTFESTSGEMQINSINSNQHTSEETMSNQNQVRSPSKILLPYSLEDGAIHPVIILFRRTRKRQFGCTSSAPLPSFRLDDECERAASLVRRLAPTLDTEPQPDAWDELVHDATEFLLPCGSILPPEEESERYVEMDLDEDVRESPQTISFETKTDEEGSYFTDNENSLIDKKDGKNESQKVLVDEMIPLDAVEEKWSRKLSKVRKNMALRRKTQNMNLTSHDEDVEVTTIRVMIQQALGLAFVRTSKVVMGVSVHGGSGIVIARLSDGTWSAPSAIGTYGLGLGIQFGLEVADYIFILQTQNALEHFRKGNNFTIGGNVGAAVAGVGREAYGAATLSAGPTNSTSVCDNEGEETNNTKDLDVCEMAPIVAYARSQGLYFGVSLEGSKIYTRDDINVSYYDYSLPPFL